MLYRRLLPLLITFIVSEDSFDKDHKAVILLSYLISLGSRGKDKLVREVHRKML